jgi:hypothetical protein
MGLKSIRESYSRFLTVLSDAGIKINESQKADLDTFMLALESTMRKQKEKTIKVTRKVVTEALDKEYKKVFESFLKHSQQNAILAAAIEKKITKINESKKIARKVNDYLELYVESILPEKKIVDYDKMKKLEKIVESVRDTLHVNDESIEAHKAKLDESFEKQRGAYETKIAKLQVKLNESMNKSLTLKKKVDKFKSLELMESKTKDLPTFEARQLKKKFAESTPAEIEENFDKELKKIKTEANKVEQAEETTLEDEVKEIIKTGETKKKETKKPEEPEETDDTEDTETEEVDSEETDDATNESDVIDSSLMKLWINRSLTIS